MVQFQNLCIHQYDLLVFSLKKLWCCVRWGVETKYLVLSMELITKGGISSISPLPGRICSAQRANAQKCQLLHFFMVMK